MSIFGLVGKVLKKKFGKPEEKTVHEQYMELRLAAEELALSHGSDFRKLYKKSFRDMSDEIGREDAATFFTYRADMEKLFVRLSQIEQRHWSVERDDKDLFGDL